MNSDIDELVLSKSGRSVFEAAEQSVSGFIRYHGRWIIGVDDHAGNDVADRLPRHRDFAVLMLPDYRFSWAYGRRDMNRCLPKWTVVPNRCPPHVQWHVHSIASWLPSYLPCRGDFSFRRFIGQARAAHVFSPRRILLLRGLAGVGSGDVPPQRTLALGGAGTLRGYALKQFAGDRAVLGTAEYWLYPASPWPGLVFFYDGGTAWTRGRPRPGWKSDLGLGLDWPGGGPGYVRLDVGFPLDRGGSGRRARVYGQLRFPF